MPNRIIKESIWTSPNLNKLSDDAELFFYRLLPLPDDHGCFEATPDVLKGRVFPKKPNWTVDRICMQLKSIASNCLVNLWLDGERLYGVFNTFSKHQSIRSTHKRKTPEPVKERFNNQEVMDFLNAIEINCKQLNAVARSNPNPNPNPINKELVINNKTMYASDDKKTSSDAGNDSKLKKFYFDFDKKTFIGITEEDKERWKKAYPALDIETEILEAGEWLIAHPKNKKSDYPRYLNGWFNRSQDKAARVGPSKKQETMKERYMREKGLTEEDLRNG